MVIEATVSKVFEGESHLVSSTWRPVHFEWGEVKNSILSEHMKNIILMSTYSFSKLSLIFDLERNRSAALSYEINLQLCKDILLLQLIIPINERKLIDKECLSNLIVNNLLPLNLIKECSVHLCCCDICLKHHKPLTVYSDVVQD
jgi:hypothetical protein